VILTGLKSGNNIERLSGHADVVILSKPYEIDALERAVSEALNTKVEGTSSRVL